MTNLRCNGQMAFALGKAFAKAGYVRSGLEARRVCQFLVECGMKHEHILSFLRKEAHAKHERLSQH